MSEYDRVWRLDGEEAWVLIHVEVQNQAEVDFGERMFVYHYRIFDRFRRPMVSLAVLGDEQIRTARTLDEVRRLLT